MSATYTPGVPRLGVPALRMSDASMGVTNPGCPPGRATPRRRCLRASRRAGFNPALARASGRAIGREARSKGINVQLAGGNNLLRDPRNGRNFEYLGEDPALLAGTLAGATIRGIQSDRVYPPPSTSP